MFHNKLSGYDLVLGSSSERRLQLLKETLKITNLSIIKPSFEENLSKNLKPEEYVYQTSLHKLQAIINENEFTKPTIIICCDTIIDCQGDILEKPGTKARQLEMLNQYRKTPELKVISSVQIAKIDDTTDIVGDTVTTKLIFDSEISEEVIKDYCESEEGLNVAGGFKYQELGNVLFKSLEGDYFNVVGLPVKATFELLIKLL